MFSINKLFIYSTIKPVKKEHTDIGGIIDLDADDNQDSDQNREPSPELARISALVTRPPKQKTPSLSKF